jgi:hypothetical protein
MNTRTKMLAVSRCPPPTVHRPLSFLSNMKFAFCNYKFAFKLLFLAMMLPYVFAATATGQEYSFSVPKLQLYATVQPEGSLKIDYTIEFHNNRGAHPIDIVDIGTPRAGYRLGDIRAWIDDQPLHEIHPSTEVQPGFEVHLESGTIMPGGTGKLRVVFTMPKMVYQDTTRDDYVSLRITPTWFGEKYVTGNTNIQVAIQLPKGVKPEDVLHQGQSFTQKALTKEGVVVYWGFPNERLTRPHLVAVSFLKGDLQLIKPEKHEEGKTEKGDLFITKEEMPIIKQTPIDLLLKWFGESTEARIVCGLIFLALFAILFFRFSGGTGFSVFFILSGAACVGFYFSPGWHLISLPVVVVLIGLNECLLGKRKMHYMPPIAQVEGGGIKRGLTAPEAAVLLELPIAKVLALVIFGMLKKGILRQTNADPLSVSVNEAFHLKSPTLKDNMAQHTKFYRDAAQKNGVVVHSYEEPFLFLLENNPDKPVKDIDFGVPMRQLIAGAAGRMAGFNLRDTQDYYRSIIKRAAEQAAAIGDIPQRQETVDRNFEWILMDNHYPTVFTGWPYQPMWMRGGPMSIPGTAGQASSGTPAPSVPSSAPSIPGQTTFKDVAASFSGWAENTMGNMASAIGPGSLGTVPSAGGFLDLSGADHVTGEIFQALSEASTSGGGGGGGGLGGGCACACAGCACACACAGGGR